MHATPETRILCWHFAADTLRDGSPLPRKGERREHSGAVKCCESGYHGSEKPIDALRYAPGKRIARVWLSGKLDSQEDKHAASVRENETDYVDASAALRLFATDCAERALTREREAAREPDPRSWAAIKAARQFARGQSTAADRAVAGDAAGAAAWAAAGAAAWAAAGAAAWAAARDAARAAAWAAARDAAWAAEFVWQNERLTYWLNRALAGTDQNESED